MSNNSQTYSNSPLGGSERRRKNSFIGTIFFIIHLALTMSLSVALVISYLTPYISPKSFGSLTIMGHFAHVLFIMVVVCMLVWLIARRWKLAGMVALLLIPGLAHFSQFYNVAFMRKAENKPMPKNMLTVVSYNVRGFQNDSCKRAVADYADFIASSNAFSQDRRAADIICLQEFSKDVEGIELVDSLLKSDFKEVYVRDVKESEYAVLRTYSRHKIIDAGSIAGTGRGTTQWVDVLKDDDTIRVFNNHFFSMSISSADSADISRGTILNDGDRVKSIIDRVADNSSVRIDHVDSLRKVIDATPYRHIVVGDFNDTPMSYVYKSMTENLTDLFAVKGSGFGYTYRPLWGWLRIDYVLYSEGFEPVGYKTNTDITLSDHVPVIAQFKVADE